MEDPLTHARLALVMWGLLATSGCAAAPLAIDAAAGVVFGTAGFVQRRLQTDEIKELKKEVRRLREALGYGPEATVETEPDAVGQVAPSLPADVLVVQHNIQVP